MTGPGGSTPNPKVPLERWLRRRRWQRRVFLLLGLVGAGLLIVFRLPAASNPLASLDRARGEVVAVIDSRTLSIHLGGREQPVAITLAGLAAWPDGRDGDLTEVRRRLVGQAVELDTDAPSGAYVYGASGLFVNEHLIDQGIAPHDVTSEHRASAWFARLERYARTDSAGPRGRWAELADSRGD